MPPVAANGEPVTRRAFRNRAVDLVGMGKLGGGGLNFRPDIDLIFRTAEHGGPGAARRELRRQFLRVSGRRLIRRWISNPQWIVFVYRVDMRLRPFGDGDAGTH